MRICIVGGQLQGLEAIYLAQPAAYEVTIIDRDPWVPARNLTNHFINMDLLKDEKTTKSVLKEFDLVIPATENPVTLAWLQERTISWEVPFAFDDHTYKISSSKVESNKFFKKTGIPLPMAWPSCGFPAIFKPSNLSGSSGVKKIKTFNQLKEISGTFKEEAVIQEFVEGPSYSLEVLAHQGESVGLQVTQLEFDEIYDCKRVLAGPNIGTSVEQPFFEIGERIAAGLELSGIMDIEVIGTKDGLRVLEIDARLPSQTPSVVYHSTGVNILELLAQYWVEGKLPTYQHFKGDRKAVVYEHLQFKDGFLRTAGEHILRGAQGLKKYSGDFEAEVIISNFEQTGNDWVATVICVGDTESEAWASRNKALRKIQQEFQSHTFIDSVTRD